MVLELELSDKAYEDLRSFVIRRKMTGNDVGPGYEFCFEVCRAFIQKKDKLFINEFSE